MSGAGRQALRAVIFDLWDTLVLWSREGHLALLSRMADHAGVDAEALASAFDRTHEERATGPLLDNVRAVLTTLGVDGDHAEALAGLRREHTRRSLVPRDGAIETLEELRRRGLRRGLISVCSGDVEDVWGETPLAQHLDDVVLSCAVGLRKPDPRIYLLACERLGVEPRECLFVGDGANDELAGAQRVGMRAACILRPRADESLWPEARGWEPTIRDLREVLELV
jgi:putative hydrolase of the HAD superfamily